MKTLLTWQCIAMHMQLYRKGELRAQRQAAIPADGPTDVTAQLTSFHAVSRISFSKVSASSSKNTEPTGNSIFCFNRSIIV
jgi:hypothetical protein